MVKAIGKVALLSMFASVAIYAVNLTACQGCHGKNFEKKALGNSKIVKDMSKEEIIKALKGYKDGTYGGPMKGTMKGQVANLSDADIVAMAEAIKGGGGASEGASKEAPKAEAKKVEVKEIANEGQYSAPDLTKPVDEKELGLRKTTLEDEKVAPPEVKFNAPAPGSGQKFARSYVNAPPLIPHSVEGLLPITRKQNACLDCHMPDKAKAVGATPIPKSHFTNYRPHTKIGKDGAIVKEGKAVANTSDIKVVAHDLKHLSMARFNCTQCHVPQANVKPLVKNTFTPDFKDKSLKEKSNLADVIDEGVK